MTRVSYSEITAPSIIAIFAILWTVVVIFGAAPVDVHQQLDRILRPDNRRAESNDQHARIYTAFAEDNAENAQCKTQQQIRAAYDNLQNQMRVPLAMNGDQSKRSLA